MEYDAIPAVDAYDAIPAVDAFPLKLAAVIIPENIAFPFKYRVDPIDAIGPISIPLLAVIRPIASTFVTSS